MSNLTFVRVGSVKSDQRWVVLLSHRPAKDRSTVTRLGFECASLTKLEEAALKEARALRLEKPIVEQVTRVYG